MAKQYIRYVAGKFHRQRNLALSMSIIGEGDGTALQYSCLENPMDRGAWWAAVRGVAKSRTRLSDFTFIFHLHALEKEMETHSSVLAWRMPGTGSLVGCRLWGRTQSDTTEATQQQQQHVYNRHRYVVVQSLSCVQLFCHPMDHSLPGSLSLGYPRQEY